MAPTHGPRNADCSSSGSPFAHCSHEASAFLPPSCSGQRQRGERALDLHARQPRTSRERRFRSTDQRDQPLGPRRPCLPSGSTRSAPYRPRSGDPSGVGAALGRALRSAVGVARRIARRIRPETRNAGTSCLSVCSPPATHRRTGGAGCGRHRARRVHRPAPGSPAPFARVRTPAAAGQRRPCLPCVLRRARAWRCTLETSLSA